MIGIEAWKNFFKALGSFLGIVLILAATYFTSWIITIGIIWLIFKLLNITFTVKVATGIWLALVFLERFIKGSRGK
ncbi:hypothetical protein DWY95_08270 [Faecalibacterium sp. AF28-13AC]|nr:hypothetical protein DWY95_08270 [Faecalibacterium sp. AF28-13AC]DAZ79188.1 MAG TPA: hypothetical protein [Caudoviricetes sp.]